MQIDAKTNVELPWPEVDLLLDLGRRDLLSVDRVRLLCGHHADAILAALGPLPAEATYALIRHLSKHFAAEGAARLAWLLSRYGEAIERDLSFFHEGLDLLDLWRNDEQRNGRPPLTVRKVLAYIDGLPSFSAFIEASAQDDEVAEMYANQETGDDPVPPRIVEWTPERQELVRVVEALQNLTAMVSSALGGNSPPPKPLPRPETAVDRYAARVQEASYDYLIEQIEEAQAREGGD